MKLSKVLLILAELMTFLLIIISFANKNILLTLLGIILIILFYLLYRIKDSFFLKFGLSQISFLLLCGFLVYMSIDIEILFRAAAEFSFVLYILYLLSDAFACPKCRKNIFFCPIEIFQVRIWIFLLYFPPEKCSKCNHNLRSPFRLG
jgi:hypothetical protein